MIIDGFEKSATLNRQFLLLKEKADAAYDYLEHCISIKGSSHRLICFPELWYLVRIVLVLRTVCRFPSS